MTPGPASGRVLPRLAALAALSFLLHALYLVSPLPERNRLPMEEGIHLELAHHLASEGRLYLDSAAFATAGPGETTLYWTPFYPALLAGFIKAGIDPARGAAWLQVVLVSLLPALLWPLASRLLRGRWLWGMLILAALYPYPFQPATQVASETTAQFLALACLSLAVSDPLRSPWRSALLGTLLAWLCLDRPEFLLFAALVSGWVSWRAWAMPHARVGLAVAAVCFAAWIAPWLQRNHALTGAWIFTTRPGYSLAYQNEYVHRSGEGEVASEAAWRREFPSLPTEMERYAYLKGRARAWIAEHPGQYALLCVKRQAALLFPYEARRVFYAWSGGTDVQPGGMPAWSRFGNAVFLALYWAGYGSFLARLALGARMPFPGPKTPEGLLLAILCAQFAVYTFLAYGEGQRSMFDLEILLLLAWAGLRLRPEAAT